MRRGEVWWASLGDAALGDPAASAGGTPRPVLVLQADEFNDSALGTTICAVITSNLPLAAAPGNFRLSRRASGLQRDSVVNVAQLITVHKRLLTSRIRRLPPQALRGVEAGIRLVLAL